jgi:hypothetical protein
VKSIEALANQTADRLNRELLRKGFVEWLGSSRSGRFHAGAALDGAVEVMTAISRTLPSDEWKVDFGIELVSKTIDDWLESHSAHTSRGHRAASTRLSKLRQLNINLAEFASERTELKIAELVSTLSATVNELIPRVSSFSGFVATVDADDSFWTVTFEGRVAIIAIREGLDAAMSQAHGIIDAYRRNGARDNVIRYYDKVISGLY